MSEIAELREDTRAYPVSMEEAYEKPKEPGPIILSEATKGRIIDIIRDSISDHDDAEFILKLVIQSQQLDAQVKNTVDILNKSNKEIELLNLEINNIKNKAAYQSLRMEMLHHRDRADFLSTFMMSITKIEKIPINKREHDVVSAQGDTEYEERGKKSLSSLAEKESR